jgi:hypothetical protein
MMWVEDPSIAEVSALLNAITYITHKNMFAAGVGSLLVMQGIPEVRDVLPVWPSVYNALSVICNRCSPLHQDRGTLRNGLDLLVSIGGDPTLTMNWPLFKTRVAYSSGTVVLFSGASVPHQVDRSSADRVCLAFYMKEEIHRWCKVRLPNQVEYGEYLAVQQP